MSRPYRASPLRPEPEVYGMAAWSYQDSGLGSPLPLPRWRKFPPPTGYTGNEGRSPTPAQISRWRRERPHHNLALRLVRGLLGVDVDAYTPKLGGQTLVRASAEWGPLPRTVRSTARGADTVSGVYLFRVPPDIRWPSVIPLDLRPGGPPGHIELIHYGLRYVTAWPSIHPAGLIYQWWDGAAPRQGPPSLMDLPELPPGWVDGLTSLVREPMAAPAGQAAGPAGSGVVRDAPADLLAAAELVRRAAEGERSNVLNRLAYALGGDSSVDAGAAKAAVVAAAVAAGLTLREATDTFDSGWAAGRASPYR